MNNQTSILERALVSNESKMTHDAASFLWGVRLNPLDEKRSNELAAKSRRGTLSEDERREIDDYRRVGRLIEMLRIQAYAVMNRPK